MHVETTTSCCLLQAMQWRFGLGWCIYRKRYIICIVCICNSFCLFCEKIFSFIRSIDVRSTSSRQIRNSEGVFVSSSRTPAKILKKSVPPSFEGTLTFVFLQSFVMAVTVSLGRPLVRSICSIFRLKQILEMFFLHLYSFFLAGSF